MEIHDIDEEILFGDREDQMVPPSLRTTANTMDMAFHPHLPLLAAGLVTGEVELFHHASGGCMIKKPLENDFSSWIFQGGDTSHRTRLAKKHRKPLSQPLYDEDEVVLQYRHGNLQLHPHGGVRALEFTDDGSYLVSASSDRTVSVLDCATSKIVIHLTADSILEKTARKKTLHDRNTKNDGADAVPLSGGKSEKTSTTTKKKKKGASSSSFSMTPNPHEHGISALNVCDEHLVATGDDDGLIALWDMRSRQPAFVYHEHGDYVSQLLYFTDVGELVSSSGDTCLGVYDVRKGKIRDFSEKRKDELLCFAFIQSSGVSASFIPSIFCGTTNGSLPLWKFGSWRRPYDVMEGHPGEVEAMVAFHGEESPFNHNIVLTGACDGVVRVMEMYPLRRALCHLSVRDTVQGGEFHSSIGSRQKREHMAVRRERGSEAIRRLRVSHDGALLAASGYDALIDFADVRFLNDEKALNALRRKREQRYMQTLRDVEIEQRQKDEEDDEEEEEVEGTRGKKGKNVQEAEEVHSPMKRAGHASLSSPSDSSSSCSSVSSDDDEEEEDTEATHSKDGRKKITFLSSSLPLRKKAKKEAPPRAISAVNPTTTHTARSGDVSLKSQEGESRGKEVSPKKEKTDERGARDGTKKKKKEKERVGTPGENKRENSATTDWTLASHSQKDAPNGGDEKEKTKTKKDGEEEEVDWMEEYKSDRMKKRDRAAAARWLKEEKKKKVNFKYEKRRRRVGGFFADLQD